jgi:hypothetical protein
MLILLFILHVYLSCSWINLVDYHTGGGPKTRLVVWRSKLMYCSKVEWKDSFNQTDGFQYKQASLKPISLNHPTFHQFTKYFNNYYNYNNNYFLNVVCILTAVEHTFPQSWYCSQVLLTSYQFGYTQRVKCIIWKLRVFGYQQTNKLLPDSKCIFRASKFKTAWGDLSQADQISKNINWSRLWNSHNQAPGVWAMCALSGWLKKRFLGESHGQTERGRWQREATWWE